MTPLPGSDATEGLGQQIAEAQEMERARMAEAQEMERARIAEELHDGPAQGITSACVQVEVIERALRANQPVDQELESLRRLLERELDRLRGFIAQLRPQLLEETGLEMALEELAEQAIAETGTPVHVQLDAPSVMLDGSGRSAALRVAQEAFRNVRKHAAAKHVRLLTRLERDQHAPGTTDWVLEVQDDGRGFSVDEALSLVGRRHFGLRFMRERAHLIGARLDILSASTGGTTIRLTLDARERS